MESQHTIGYGLRYMTDLCPPAYLTLCVQCVVGVFLQTILAGIVIAKILRPKKRRQVCHDDRNHFQYSFAGNAFLQNGSDWALR